MPNYLRSLLVIPALVGSLGCPRGQAQERLHVEGTILGVDGRPLPMAHARLLSDNPLAPLLTVAADREGRFTLTTSQKPGSYSLAFSGVGHEWAELSLPLFSARSFRLQVRLGTLEVAKDLSGAGLMVQDGSGKPIRVPLVPQGDGTYAADITAQGREVRYQVDHALCLTEGVLSRCALEGTQGMGYEPVVERYYKSILPLVDGKAHVVFDPKRLPQGSREAVLSFEAQDRDLAEIWRIDQERHAIMKFMTGQQRETALSMPDRMARNEAFCQPHVQRWTTALEGEKDPAVRQALGSALLLYGPKDKGAVLKAFPVASPFWKQLSALDRTLLAGSFAFAPEATKAALRPILLEHLDAESWKKRVLPTLNMFGPGKAEAEVAALEALSPGHPTTRELRQALGASPARLAKGQPFPRFQLPSLEDPRQVLSLDTFKGRYLLVDFWAVWCKPCVAELPGLHKAFEAFKGRGLEVLSLSFDPRLEDIQAYRQSQRMPMPWKHAWLDGGPEHAFSKQLEVTAIPRAFLVGPDGRILAMDGELRGPALEQTLARLLGKP
jgi:peroxiredoxin